MSTGGPDGVLRFGAFELDPTTCELRRRGIWSRCPGSRRGSCACSPSGRDGS